MAKSYFEKVTDGYLREIKSLMVCDDGTKKKFLKDLKRDVYDYTIEENADSIEMIIEHFGTPEEIAKSFFESADIKKIKRKMNFRRVILVGVLAALLIWIVYATVTVIDAHWSYNGYHITTFEESAPVVEHLNLFDLEGIF